jgi:phosphopantetheinyl transferase
MADLASEFLTSPELDRLALVDEADRLATLYRMWTRKEAWLKAHGVGLSVPLASVPLENLDVDAELHHLEPALGYVGAVAVIAPPRTS